MRKIILAYPYLPPAFDVSAKRVYRLARYLPDHGWHPIVLTGPEPPRDRRDPSLEALPPTVRVDRRLYPDGWRTGLKRQADPTVSEPVRSVRPRRWWRGQLTFPVGSDLPTVPATAARMVEVAREEQADAILASGGPYGILVAGAIAKARTSLTLCLDFRDPWSLNFLQRTRGRAIATIDRWIERAVVRRADHVVFTSEESCAAYRRLYPRAAGRMSPLYYGFDPADAPGRRQPDGPVTVVHFGNCYGPRRLTAVLHAIAGLDRADLVGGAFKLVNLGRVQAEDLELADRLGVSHCLEVRRAVPYRDGLEQLAAADLQLLLGFGEETLHVPGKFFDYLLTGAPILALCPRSEVTRLVAETGAGVAVAPDDVEGVRRQLIAAIRSRERTRARPTLQQRNRREQLTSPVIAAQLAGVLDRIRTSRPE